MSKSIQWNKKGDVWIPIGEINLHKKIDPGYYRIGYQDGQLLFNTIDVDLNGLVSFKDGAGKKITDQISLFWKSEKRYRDISKSIKVIYKRGILMYGPPGCGKTALISIIMKGIVASGGVAILFSGSELTAMAVKAIKDIQPGTKILIVMEDIDGYIRRGGEEDLLDMLDGVHTNLDSVIFLATTNNFNALSKRMLRPSRFDLKVQLDFPGEMLRAKYLSELAAAGALDIDIDKWVSDTDGFSFADLKELFISASILGYDYNECLSSIRDSSEHSGLLDKQKKPESKMSKLIFEPEEVVFSKKIFSIEKM